MRFLDKFIQGVWNVGVIEKSIGDLMNNPNDFKIRWVKHKYKDRFFADPFLYKVDEIYYYILVEEYPYYTNIGHISLLKVNKKSMKLVSKKVVLKEKWHLSYPFVCGDKIIPEAYRSGCATEYEFDGEKTSNPRQFFQKGLIDQTIISKDGNDYLFSADKEKPLALLNIYHKKTNDQDWSEHYLNPVKDNIKTSRPGGKFFWWNGNLYRPVQDSEERYGRRIRIMQVEELSETNFKEKEVVSFSSDDNPPYNLGLHTFNVENGFIVVDGYREYKSFFIRPMCLKLPKIMKYFGEKNED